jgi:lipopolysaccharide transport system ATP-binding protein
MARTAIRVEHLAKRYQLGDDLGLPGTLYETLSGLFRQRARPAAQELWALRDVSFEIHDGEVAGIIGRNGAGKSTLLKILSRITAPTRGRAVLQGRLASLLEVGTGFHPELTGRENIYLNGAILGMTRAEIGRQFDDIVQFAEVGAFVDTPVKRYSSGMYVRLAFSVAAHLDPDILVIDEVLAVGDARFQKRCLGKMRDIAGKGRTVLFVSHNMHAVQRLCSRAIWLSGGEVRADGEVADVVGAYLREGVQQLSERVWNDPDSAPGNEQVAIARLAVEPLQPSASGVIDTSSGARLTFEYWNRVEGAALNLSLHVFTSDDTLVFNAVPAPGDRWFGESLPVGRFRGVCEIPPHLLNSDTYRVELLVVRDQAHIVYSDEAAISFEVAETYDDNGAWHGRQAGIVKPRLRWSTTWLDETVESAMEES